jgi:phosphatidylserine decarboxylase
VSDSSASTSAPSVPRALRGPIAGPAYPISAGLLGLAAAAAALGAALPAALACALSALNLAFFRNPSRRIPAQGILAPGDGRVVEVAALAEPDPYVGAATRVAIFLSVLDVHVNRAPLSAKVRAVRRSGSRYRAAFRADASSLNVQSRMDLETCDGRRLAVVQITGLIARRILCYAREGDLLERGAPYGVICYGSRMELVLPRDARVCVRPGDRVTGGESVLAELKS